jgi:hypothetical protein
MLPAALDDLARSGISEADAQAAGLFDVQDASTVYPDFEPVPAIVIPYYRPDGELMTFERDGETRPFCRVRYLAPPVTRAKGFGGPPKVQRYSQPGNSGTRAYFAPTMDWPRVLADAHEPIIITEGEKKALAAIALGYPVIALGGVFNFAMSRTEELLPELADIPWRQGGNARDLYIVFDSDAATNGNIQMAEARLIAELGTKRGARVIVIRLPPGPDGEKVGLDDFLEMYGAPAFTALLQNTLPMGTLDQKIISLNRSCAWIDREGMVYDLDARMFLPKDSFVSGSRFSTLKHITLGGKQRSTPQEISVAAKWLTHPHAQRFSEILFRPGEGSVVESESGRPALNMWNGWHPEFGDVQPFLDLTTFLFQNLPPAHQDLPLKLMAYKAQNPQEKVPLALVLLGNQGCGKSLWGECIRDAFAPYGVDCTSKSFYGEFQGWLETSLVALINEAEGDDVLKGGDVLKGLISDLMRPMNEKFRPARQIRTYTFYILTSNRRSVGSFSADDRRMIVANCPDKHRLGNIAAQDAFFGRMKAWKRVGGPKTLLGYLTSLDLKGWQPPAQAPMTAEKHLAYTEGLTSVQALAEDMRTADNQSIVQWLDAATAWAAVAEVSNNAGLAAAARATLDGMKHMQVRPFYEPREIALLFPNLVSTLLGSKLAKNTTTGQISRELREAGVPYLVNKDDVKGFHWKGQLRQYLIIADADDWQQPISQQQFENYMNSWPMYGRRRVG